MHRFLFAVLIAGSIVSSCGESGEDQIDSLASIHGTVLMRGDWPDEGEIQISLFSTWHENLPLAIAPQGPPDFHTEALISPTPGAQTHQLDYRIEDINPDSYPSLVVGWRNGGTTGVDEPVLGLFGGDFANGDTLPELVVLSAGDDLEVDFDGWLDRIPGQAAETFMASVAGNVNFADGWPQSYASLFAIVMTSSDPAAPNQPLAMEDLTPSDSHFELNFEVMEGAELYLAIYGYPYTVAEDAFLGGAGWDWSAVEPALGVLALDSSSPNISNLALECRTPEPLELALSLAGTVEFPAEWPMDYPSIYVIAMASPDHGAPSMPLDMDAVTPTDPQFSMSLQQTEGSDLFLAVYGYPYSDPLNAFYGGYAWDWDAAQPALGALPFSADQTELTELLLECRAQ